MDSIQLMLINLYLEDVLLLVTIIHMETIQQHLVKELQRIKMHSIVITFLTQILRVLLLMQKANQNTQDT